MCLPQGHDCTVRSMAWTHNGTWMLTTDDRGFVKYWQSNLNNVHTFQAHNEPVRCSRWDRTTCSLCNTSVVSVPVVLIACCACASNNYCSYLLPHTGKQVRHYSTFRLTNSWASCNNKIMVSMHNKLHCGVG